MAETTTSQFGRRGVALAQAAAMRRPEASASTALQLAIGRSDAAPALPPDMADAIAKLNRSMKSGGAAVIERGPTAPAPDLMTKLFSTKGRIRRRDYWTFNIAASMIAILTMITAAIVLPAIQALLFAVPVAMVSLRIRSCLRIKRWHDRDKTSLWVLIGLVPFVGWLWSFIECGLLEGTPGENRFGLSPK